MKLLLYCVKAKPYITRGNDGSVYPSCVISDGIKEWHLNGKIVAECDFEVEEIENRLANNNSHLELFTDSLTEKELFEKSCLTRYEIFKYLKNDFSKKGESNGYAIHIKNLHIFDEPKELDYYYTRPKKVNTFDWYRTKGYEWVCESIDKAPQNMMYAQDENQNKQYILISIKPQWLCKILNGEKTIEVRKKVLKEMIK